MIYILILLAITVVVLSVLLFQINGAKNRIKTYSAGLEKALMERAIEQYEMDTKIKEIIWERDAAHMMIEHLLNEIPEKHILDK